MGHETTKQRMRTFRRRGRLPRLVRALSAGTMPHPVSARREQNTSGVSGVHISKHPPSEGLQLKNLLMDQPHVVLQQLRRGGVAALVQRVLWEELALRNVGCVAERGSWPKAKWWYWVNRSGEVGGCWKHPGDGTQVRCEMREQTRPVVALKWAGVLNVHSIRLTFVDTSNPNPILQVLNSTEVEQKNTE